MSESVVVMSLPALPESVPAARTRVRRFVRIPPTREDALALLVTELVGGMVTSGPPTPQRVVELTMTNSGDAIRVEARRTDSELLPMGLEDGETSELQMRLLDRLADGWGEEPGLRWFELRTRVPAGAQPTTRQA